MYKQKDKIYEYFETGSYEPDVFNTRMFAVNEKINSTQSTVIELEHQLSSLVDVTQKKRELIPKIKNLLDVYDTLDTYQKNDFLKEVLSKVSYTRERNNNKNAYQTILQSKSIPTLIFKNSLKHCFNL